MTADILALYQDVVLEHSRRPRNFGPLDGAARRAEGHNPLCGDRMTVHVRVSDRIVTRATFEGVGCAICIASASLMTEVVTGKTIAEVDALQRHVHDLVTAGAHPPTDDSGALSALAGVRKFPVRAKCALLPWHTLHAATDGDEAVVSTE